MSLSSIAARAIAVLALSATPVLAVTNTYQVTGPVLSVTDDAITKDPQGAFPNQPATKVTGDLKVGAKVTIEYRMTATSVEVKPAAAAPKKK